MGRSLWEGLLDAGAAFRGFKAIQLGFALRAEMAVGRLAIELIAGAIVERGVRVNPDFKVRVSVKMRGRGRNFGDSHGDQNSFPGVELGPLRCGGRPEQGQEGNRDSDSEI